MAKLKVFRGTKADVDKKAITDGAVLVATDTSTLYVDANGKRLDLTKATTVDSALSSSSTNPVQSKAIVEYVATEINKLETDKLNERLTAVEGKADDNKTAIDAINVIAPKNVPAAAVAPFNKSLAIGNNSACTSNTTSQVAVGVSCKTSGGGSASVGLGSSADGDFSFSLGVYAHALGDHSTAVGVVSNTDSMRGTAVGAFSQAIGKNSFASNNASAIGSSSVVNGYLSAANANQATVLGCGACIVGNSVPDVNVKDFKPDTQTSVALGAFSYTNESNCVSVGNDADTYEYYRRTYKSGSTGLSDTAPFWEKKTAKYPDSAKHLKRRITNVADPIDGHNAATKNYVDNLVETNKYVHPTTSGNKHVPSGGSSGQILRWSADGTAVWGAENDHTYGVATSSTAGLVKSGTDITVDSSGNVSVNNDSHTHGNSTITSVDASKVSSGVFSTERIPGLDASKITSGTISIDRLPAGALERLVTVKDQTAMYALTTDTVQLGDTVKRLDTGVMYVVVDTANLSSSKGYMEYTAGSASSVPWSGVTSKPSTFTPSAHKHTVSEITDMADASVKYATSAGSANKLNTNAGGSTTPVYFSNGIPIVCTSYADASVRYATKATNDAGGNAIHSTYIKGVSSDGSSLILTKGDGVTSIVPIQESITLTSSSNTSKGKYLKFATVDLTSGAAWKTCAGTLSFVSTETGYAVKGTLRFKFRNGNTAGTVVAGELCWTSLSAYDHANSVVAVKNTSNAYDLYYKPISDYEMPYVTLSDVTGIEHFKFENSKTYVDSVTPSYTSQLASCASYIRWSDISGKPAFASVATSGSYNDLSNKPTIPSVGNGTVTITQNGVSKGSFTLNQSGNATIALTDTDTNTTYSAISPEDINSLFFTEG